MAAEPWLRLLAADVFVDRCWRELFATYGDVAEIVALPRATLEAAGVDLETVARLAAPDTARIEHWQRWLDRPARHLITLADPDYPSRLADVADPPLALWAEGIDIGILDRPQLAIVGSRNPTRGGSDTATTFARYFAERGLVITSGMAQGIDTASHVGALAAGGATIAVLGAGLDQLYPHANVALAERIRAAGLLVSEYPPETTPKPFHFPRRNRIIAAISMGTLVVEAARHSGSLITARLASEYGREVFAIPGSIHNPLAKGCHALIRDGAKLVDDAADVLLEIAPQLAATASDTTRAAERDAALTKQPQYAELLDALAFEPTAIATLAQRVGLTTGELSSMLLVLELEGLVEALPGGRYARLSQRD